MNGSSKEWPRSCDPRAEPPRARRGSTTTDHTCLHAPHITRSIAGGYMRSNRANLRTVSLAATLPMVAGALALGIPAAHAAGNPGRDTLAGTKPAWATAKADKGATSDSSQVSARVYLAGRDASGLAAYAKSVSDPSSALYGKYLSAAQVQQRFGATPAQVTAVKSWLKSAGLKVTGTTQHYVTVSGDVAAVEKAFSTSLHNYSKGSKTYRAP